MGLLLLGHRLFDRRRARGLLPVALAWLRPPHLYVRAAIMCAAIA